MNAPFDPYYKWLGIPPAEQPPNRYRLLGLALYEDDREVIAQAADRQMTFVQLNKIGPYSDESQRLLNELALARVALLNPKKKAEYDAQLRAELAARAQPPAFAPLPPAPPPAAPAPPPVAIPSAPPAFAPLSAPAEPLSASAKPPSPSPAFAAPAFEMFDDREPVRPASATSVSRLPAELWIGGGVGVLALVLGLLWVFTSGPAAKENRLSSVAQKGAKTKGEKDAPREGGIVMPELGPPMPVEEPAPPPVFPWLIPPSAPRPSSRERSPAPDVVSSSPNYRPPVRAADIEDGYRHLTDIDCTKGRRQIEPAGIDFARSWSLRFEARLETLALKRQQILLFWGDERPQLDPFFVSVWKGEWIVSVTDVPASTREKLQAPVARQAVNNWTTLQIDFTATDKSVRFYVDRRLVAETTVAGPPTADRPMPWFLGDADDLEQGFRGQLRNIRFGNVNAGAKGAVENAETSAGAAPATSSRVVASTSVFRVR